MFGMSIGILNLKPGLTWKAVLPSELLSVVSSSVWAVPTGTCPLALKVLLA